VILVGAQTVRREGYGSVRLPPDLVPARQAAGRAGAPRLAVVSRSLDLDWSGRAFTSAPPDSPPLVAAGRLDELCLTMFLRYERPGDVPSRLVSSGTR
jgi:riboflavin biosynthesis pyrimidine reductase